MPLRAPANSIAASLSALQKAVEALRGTSSASKAIERFSTDVAAARFHLDRDPAKARPAMIAVLGGTGTGKSTLVNRLLDAQDRPVTAASFRRTFTAGPVAITHTSSAPPDRWLGLDHTRHDPASAPARGEANSLTVIRFDHQLLENLSLVDTPDLDGDQPAHHAQADRVFRWADAVIFLVTPEKYQMTELLPYYELSRRYAVPALFVMNKTEEQAVVDDYVTQLGVREQSNARVFGVARDGSSYSAASGSNLQSLRTAIPSLAASQADRRETGNAHRVEDLLNRFHDQVIDPLHDRRRRIDRAIESLRAMEAAGPDVDVSPLMMQLRRRLQQRSVLYLMGPGRMLDRVRQVPGLLARLPRTAWDLVRHGQVSSSNGHELPAQLANAELDFHEILSDQMSIVQARVQDVVSTASIDTGDLREVLIDTNEAGAIADEEIAELRDWLTKKWNATPRDTALITKLVKHVPGAQKLAQWSEAAPYLLAIVVATHHAFFGPVDLMVIGGWSLATWMSEKLSNEVAWRARQTNAAINRRFAQLAHQQITRVCTWLDGQAPTTRAMEDLQSLADRAAQALE